MAKNNSELKGIRKKLVAAIAMVLVACIMVVSSSYAWFTLSTAPEVKGIQTSVGSNGNLEMALIPETGDLDDITTKIGEGYPESNNTWGNLVDLSHPSYYMSEMSLTPARLNFTGNTVAPSYLFTPVYGTDGRVSKVEPNAQSGQYNGTQFVANEKYGVRAIGVASDLSAGDLALRDARSAVNTAQNTVTRLSRKSLEVDAINLANLMIAKQLDSGKTTVTEAEWLQVTKAVENLRDIADELKTTMDKVVTAVAVSQGKTITTGDIQYSNSGVTVTGVTIDAALNAGLGKAYAVYSSINGKVTSAEGTITEATTNGTTGEYATVETIMTQILSKQDLTITDLRQTPSTDIGLEGQTPDTLLPVVVFAVLNNEGKLPLNVVAGLYKEIADFIGQYSASSKITVDLTGSEYEQSMHMSSVSVTAQIKVATTAPEIPTDPAVNAYLLNYFVTELNKLTASNEGNTGDVVLSDIYAYAIDLAFRTNAANSNLMLQTAAASRVGDDTAASVQGGGSYMQFAIGDDENYTVDQMKDLMDAIRVVLMSYSEDGTMTIYGIAKLDMNVAEDVTIDGKAGIKAYLYLYNYSQNAESGVLEIGEKIVEGDGTKTTITALTQNQVLGLTALVYLDGDYVDNSDVAIRGDSMTGTVNLQFSSSAELDPMDYTFTDGTTAPANP